MKAYKIAFPFSDYGFELSEPRGSYLARFPRSFKTFHLFFFTNISCQQPLFEPVCLVHPQTPPFLDPFPSSSTPSFDDDFDLAILSRFSYNTTLHSPPHFLFLYFEAVDRNLRFTRQFLITVCYNYPPLMPRWICSPERNLTHPAPHLSC